VGRGPRTGWGMGDCGGPEDRTVGSRGRGFGLGWGGGFGRGLGRGWGRGFGRGPGRGWGRGFGLGRRWGGAGFGPGPVDDELEGLRAESARLKDELAAVERRLSSLDKQD
jgi:hypothetical protein